MFEKSNELLNKSTKSIEIDLDRTYYQVLLLIGLTSVNHVVFNNALTILVVDDPKLQRVLRQFGEPLEAVIYIFAITRPNLKESYPEVFNQLIGMRSEEDEVTLW